MDIRQLEHFVALVELGTVHAAAKHRFISQPGLSGSIKRLESQLGTALFERDGRGMHTTAKGRDFYVHAKQILEQMRLARADLDTGLNSIVIGLGEARLSEFAGYLTNELEASFPSIRLSFVEGHMDALAPQLLNGDIDLAVIYGDLNLNPLPLTVRLLARSQWIVFCRSGHPLTHIAKQVPIAELKKFGLVSNGAAPKSTPYQPIFRDRKTKLLNDSRCVIAATEQMAKELILNTNLLGYGPRYSIYQEQLRGELVEIRLPIEKYFIDIAIARRQNAHSAVLDRIVESTEAYYQGLKIS
ncbi:MAG: LysR family transcriptional regulator [Proteobacteria bacterium]|nr:LysR family transcriptional regulator [Pseudomonadota bacterium]